MRKAQLSSTAMTSSRRTAASGIALAACIASVLASSQARAAETQVANLEEVTVTARKRTENLQEVPISIDVLGGNRLESDGVTRVTDIEYQVPGLVLGNKGFDGASIGIRGASSLRGFTGDQAAVAVHLDGVYLPQSGQALGHLFDVERIEVLKGPQGSLYGRNAVAGVINVISRAPSDEFGGTAQASFGSRDSFRAQGALNVPLAEGQGLRIAVSGARGDGYIKNLLDRRTFGDDDFTGGRIRYSGNFGERVKIDATLQYVKDKSTEAIRPARLDSAANLTTGTSFYTTLVDTPVSTDRKDTNFALNIDFDLGFGTLRSISGLSDYKRDQVGDVTLARTPTPLLPFAADQSSKGYSEELQLFSTGKHTVDWRVGLYYMKEKVRETRFQNEVTSPFANGLTGYDDFLLTQDGESKAVFGALDFHVTDTVTISVGGRYNDEKKTQLQDETWGVVAPSGPIADCAATGGGAPICNSVDKRTYKWTGPSGDVSFNWQVTPDSLLYARAARGFRSGAVGGVIGLDNGLDQFFFGPGTFTLTKLGEEKLDSYEIGSKNTFLDRRLVLNAAVFYQKYKNQLVFTFDPATFRLIEGNLGESTYKGIELSTSFRANDYFGLDVSAAYNDAEISSVGPTVTGARKGNLPIYSPKFSAAAGFDVTAPIAAGSVSLRAEYNYKSKIYFDLANVASQDAVGLVNLSLRFDASDKKWFVFASGNNMTNKEYLTGSQRTDPAAGPGPLISRPGEPRSYEVGAGFNF